MKAKFIRFGGLSSVKQKGYKSSMPTYHSPPARRGIYCFPFGYMEMFLLSSKKCSGVKAKHAKWEYVKKKGEYVLDAWGEKQIKLKRRKIFTYSGEIWHHLDVPNKYVLKRKGEWVLTHMSVHKKALKKALRYVDRKWVHAQKDLAYSKDHLEVFIEKV